METDALTHSSTLATDTGMDMEDGASRAGRAARDQEVTGFVTVSGRAGGRSHHPGRAVGGATVPIPLTSFTGRQREVIAVERLLRREDVRLVTLVGPAGIGKTRLAIDVATEASSTFAGGARLVPLGSVLPRRPGLPYHRPAPGRLGVGAPDGR